MPIYTYHPDDMVCDYDDGPLPEFDMAPLMPDCDFPWPDCDMPEPFEIGPVDVIPDEPPCMPCPEPDEPCLPPPALVSPIGIGPKGEKGEKGDKGDKGDRGDAGTTDYEQLDNKPSIESITLIGNSTFSDLGLRSLTNIEIENMLT